MSKFVKVMYGTTSGAKSDFEYKLGEVNMSNNWNPKVDSGKEFGGFNYCDEKCILRWLHRGDTIYDVEVPKDAENIKLDGATTIYRTNKIIVKNPRKVNDDLIECVFDTPQRAITPGQAVVFYKDDYIVGGGTII